MARVTIEDCLDHVDNMYELVHVATLRTRQLLRGGHRTVRCKNKDVVCALREIAEGHVAKSEITEDQGVQTA
jgi:DNA-directed RNA polymerase subunit omega